MRAFVLAGWIVAAAVATGAMAADAKRETRNVSDFSRIEIDGQVDVTLRQGSNEGVTIEAPAQALPYIHTEVAGHTLMITTEWHRHWWDWVLGGGSPPAPRIVIDFTRLERIEAAGVVKLSADTIKADDLRLDLAGACTLRIADLQASRLRVDGSGALKAELAGKVKNQYVDLSGAGSYRADRLASDTAVLRVSGAGKASVDVASRLKVEVSGAGTVEYSGDPKIDQEVSGVAKVIRHAAR